MPFAHKGINVNLQDKTAQTPLHCFTKWKNLQILRLQLSNKDMKINTEDTEEKTPLQSAIEP